MSSWHKQLTDLIQPAVTRSSVTDEVHIGAGILDTVGTVAARVTHKRKALVMADNAGFQAAGGPVCRALEAAGFETAKLVLPNVPLPKASVEEAEVFRSALVADPELFPLSVGSGVMNDLVKYAAFETNRRYLTVATAASMDGYTSAGAPLARDGFKVTIPTRAPVAMIADLDVLVDAPTEMNAWGYGDLAGKIPAAGDWIVADALGVESIDDVAWPLVQDHLRGWLAAPEGIAQSDPDSLARLFIGLTAVGFAMEFHGSSRPASGADHQIAHIWEMDGLTHHGEKVSHGAAVAVGAVASLALYDWLLQQDLSGLDVDAVVAQAPSLAKREAILAHAIPDPRIAAKAHVELAQKHLEPDAHKARLLQLKSVWPSLREQLDEHLLRADALAEMLRTAGAPAHAAQIGVTSDYLMATLRAAGFIRRRYTIFDILEDAGLSEAAFAAVRASLSRTSRRAAE